MIPDFVDRPVDHINPLPYVRPGVPRPVKGIVLHHTASASDPASVRSDASWHWLVGRNTLYRDVSEDDIAFHVGATDRWRPAWVLASPYGVSDINFCSIGIEITDAPQNTPPQPYTDFQYTTLAALLRDIYDRYGPLPIVGHGEVDKSRWETEPHGLDWARVGIGARVGNAGHFLMENVPVVTPDPTLPPPPWDGLWLERNRQEDALRAEIDSLHASVTDAEQRYGDLNNAYVAMEKSNQYNFSLKMAMEALLRDLEAHRRLKRGTVDRIIASIPRS